MPLVPPHSIYIYVPIYYIYICKCEEAIMLLPGCRTIFVLMSNRGYSFEDPIRFSWGSLSTPHVTEKSEKKTGQITSQQSSLRRIAHVTRGVLTRCWFNVLWRDFKCISDVVQTNIGCITGHKLKDLQVGPSRFFFFFFFRVLCI